MKNLLKIVFVSSLVFTLNSCNDDDDDQRQQEMLEIQNLFSEIENLSKSETCENSEDWSFTSYGDKACGGPEGFIAYSKNIDVSAFLDKVAKHKALQEAFNMKWDVVSNCMAPEEPEGVICEDGVAKFTYRFD
ncbi:hypothetical protein [Aureivirga sp. CE67]|uniref:hypothetical protein n=1 Tax=Aureivirga sp. CE67 TaxID=1788983 RepID=UPI0018C933A1|nr:hypothetical protein [Aureivirga sp. CE67]